MIVEVEVRDKTIVGRVEKTDDNGKTRVINPGRPRDSVWWQTYKNVTKAEAIKMAKERWSQPGKNLIFKAKTLD